MNFEQYYKFGGITWRIAADNSGTIQKFNCDFKTYACEKQPAVDFEIQIVPGANAQIKSVPKFKGKNYSFDWKWKKRNFEFDQDLYGYEQIEKSRTLTISGHNHSRLREVVLSYVLSVIGELQDLKGWHRLHAFAIDINHTAIAVPLNSGNGKSSFIYWVFNKSNHMILSDETIFTNGSMAVGFFTRLALRHQPSASYEVYQRAYSEVKYLVEIPSDRINLDKLPIKLWLPSNKWNKIKFLFSFSLGLGNAQMLEFMLRADNILKLLKIFFKRLRVGIRLLNHIKVAGPWSSNEALNYQMISTNTIF